MKDLLAAAVSCLPAVFPMEGTFGATIVIFINTHTCAMVRVFCVCVICVMCVFVYCRKSFCAI